MIPRPFDAACQELFRGWHTVTTYNRDDLYVVKLTLTEERLQAARIDYRALLSKLFERSRVEDLVKVIERNGRRGGLRWYGRRR